MTDTKHTPGPWHFWSHPSFGYAIAQAAPGQIPIRDSFAQVSFADTSRGYTGEEAKANARLIAAAPELLEALERMVAAYGGVLDMLGREGERYQSDGAECAEIAARAAIAKATGGSQ